MLHQDAYLRSQASLAANRFWLSQLRHTQPFEWTTEKPKQSPAPPPQDYRRMDTWNFFSQAELEAWSELYKTSWFRVATSIVGLVTAGIAKPQPHHDHALMVALGARPQDFHQCVSHMANTVWPSLRSGRNASWY